MSPLRLGISTCPNDTFAFQALLAGRVEPEHGGDLDLEVELLDVEELNQGMAVGRFDVAKMSFAQMLARADELVLLPAGSALGFGVGPVVLARPGFDPDASRAEAHPDGPRVLCPGAGTTAHLLWRLFHPEPARVGQVVFHEIMPALARGEADLGVCIHEGRFTWQDSDLSLVEDLGRRWEEDTGCPLPLGGIAARRDLAGPLRRRLARAIRRSIELGHAARAGEAGPEAADELVATMARHAQDPCAEVLWAHVDLYVNPWTLDLGEAGARAIGVLSERARAVGFAPAELRIEDA